MESSITVGSLCFSFDLRRSMFPSPDFSRICSIRYRHEKMVSRVSVSRALLSSGDKDPVGFLERELGFKPMFNEYVKVMESVRIDRSNKPEIDGDDGHLENNFNDLVKRKYLKRDKIYMKKCSNVNVDLGKKFNSQTKGKYLKVDRVYKHADADVDNKSGDQMSRDRRFANIIGRGMKKGGESSSNVSRKDKTPELRNFGHDSNFVSKDGRARTYPSVPGGITNYYQSSYKSGKYSSESKKYHSMTRKVNYEDETRNGRNSRNGRFDNIKMNSEFLERNNEDSVEASSHWKKYISADFQKNVKTQGKFIAHEENAVKEYIPKARETDGRFDGSGTRSDMFLNREVHSIDDDRFAFKTFKVSTDVRNRPRVLRMEMEERIQDLAKLLNATDVNMPEWQFTKTMHNGKIKFTDHSILRVVQILGEFGNWRRVLQVVEWLQLHERFKSYKSKYIYTAVLNVLGKAKRPKEALNVFYAMRQEKCSYPDLASYHCIAVGLGQAGLMNELLDVMDIMRSPPTKKFKLGYDEKWDPRLEPDLVIYNAVLNACVQKKQWEGAFWVLQQLKQQSIAPSGTTYGLIMEVMLACGKYNLVHEFFKKIKKTSFPSTLSYKVLVNTFWREGKTDEAVLAVRDMERRGIVGSASLYYDLARCLSSAGRCQEALAQVDKVCKVAKKPLVVTYTGLIQVCLDSGSIKNAMYIFKEMRRFCMPNAVTCNIMLKSYIKHEMYEESKALFEEIVDDSPFIDSNTDLRMKVIPDKFTFNTMIDASVIFEKLDDFEKFYIQMLHHGYHFDKKRHLRMVMDAARAGKVKVLDVTWDHLVHSGRCIPPPIIKEKLRTKLKEGNYVAAVSCLYGKLIEESDRVFSTEAWLNLFRFNADSIKKDTIVGLADRILNILEENQQPPPLLQNLLMACQMFLGRYQNVESNS